MDVQPTTSQEVVQPENQAAVDALRRLAITRDAFRRMLDAQPSLNEANLASAQELVDALPRFWGLPETAGGESRSATLGRYLAALMKDDATLRGFDGTLRDDAVRLALQIVGAVDAPLPSGVHARELLLGGAAHAGSLVSFDDNHPGLALLFTAHGGWEAFDSLDRLLESTRRRLLEAVDVADGTGLEPDEFADAKVQGDIGSRDITGAIFVTLANRMVDVQARRVALVVDDFTLDIDVPGAGRDLGDRLREELSPAALLDIDTIAELREARLIEATIKDRLADVPANVRAAWYEARDTYNDALAGTSMLRMATDMRPPLTLRAFASRELAARLASLGIDESPEAIAVDITPGRSLPEPLGFLDPVPGAGGPVRRIPLIDLACQNIGRFSLQTLHATDASGASMDDRLGHAAIRGMVRDLDIGNRYHAHVEERLHRGAVGALARKLAMTVQGARMRMQAAEARLSYYLRGEPRSFIDDRDERGFHWVEAALDAPSGERRVQTHQIDVSQVTYRQVAVDGILVFGSRTPESAPRVVMYTPDAPDGLTFREFADRQDAARRFLYHPAFREYLLDRLPAEFARVLPNGASREFAGDHLAQWVLGSSTDTAYTRTAERFDERRISGDFLAALHDAGVEKQRRDALFLTRSTAEADKDSLFGYLQGRFSVAPVASLATIALTEIPASFSRMMQASWRLYDHVKAGDTGQAVVAFADGYVNALNLVVPPLAGGRHVASAIVRSRAAPRGMASTGVRFAPPAIRFEERYAVNRLRKPGKPDHEGIHRAGGQTYIEQDKTFFLVKLDADYGLWRLAPARGATDTRFTGPLIERVDGNWVYAHDVGLRGGMRRLRERFNRLVVRNGAAPVAAAPDPAVVQVPLPEPAPDIVLPNVMEPHRAEILAVLADNPSVRPMIRADGSSLQFIVRTRSAMIIDPHLHPDIAGLSAHQRRVFLHELDTRFPLVAERMEVLHARGWAGPDGYGPSPVGSPGATSAGDIQSSVISSSAGETASPLPALSSSQQQRWDAALAVARSSSRRPALSPGEMAIETLRATEVVPLAEWPDRIWYFSERRFEPRYLRQLLREGIALDAPPGWSGQPESLRSYPVTTLPPEVPGARLADVLGTSPGQQAGQRDPLGYWVQIDLTSARAPRQPGAHEPPPWWRGVEMRRRVLPHGEYQYTLQSRWHLSIPTTDIAGVGRRGERGHRVTQ